MKNNSFKEDSNRKTEASKETPIRVLCVDDERIYLDSTKQILELKSDFCVETATSVHEAQQKMQTTAFDVIVSDYQMPEKNGLDFLKELREKTTIYRLFCSLEKEEKKWLYGRLILVLIAILTKLGTQKRCMGN